MNNLKIKITSFMLSLTMAASGVTLLKPATVVAESNYQHGTFLEENVEINGVLYGEYIVEKGDNTSKISRKLCLEKYGVEPTEKYWPVIAFLNNFPRILQPGDKIIYPATYEALVKKYEELRKVGWLARYVQKNNIYKKNKRVALPRETIGDLLEDIYGDSVCVDDDFIMLYLETTELTDRYIISGDGVINLTTDDLFYLTEYIPTLGELEEQQENRKSK